ncbi:MAG: hypothetical protein KA810_08325, partial [Pyrinomonadaceae bacterium]|nr:hypothetical protein [Pyrinomonadaceae bacterium]
IPEVANHAVLTPRIALVHTWINTQNEGWYRIELDRLGIPYDYISDQVLGRTPNLREKWDVIIFGPVGGSAQAIVRGNPKFGESEAPIPWKASSLTPNMGMSPDQTDDIRGGMGIQGIANLNKFVEGGGLFVTVTGNASIPIDFGITSGVSIQESTALNARGSVVNTTFSDRRSPIAYGYDEGLAVYFNQAPLLQVGGGGFGGGGGGGGGIPGAGAGGATRPTGRGTLTDPDVVQGRKPMEPVAPGGGGGGGFGGGQQPQPPISSQPRVVLRFAPERDLLVSGMMAGGAELAGKAAVVDVPVGKGHVVMFANNPMWRHQTHGSFSLLFNAILHYDNLSVGRATPGAARPAGDEEIFEDQ